MLDDDDIDDDDVLLVTTDTVPGHSIERVLGLVRGWSGPPDRTHRAMIEQARKRGANAVVGVRYTSGDWLVVYGTAVVVRPT